MPSDNTLWCYGVVSDAPGDFSAKLVRDELKKFDKSKPVLLRLNTPGGSVHEGVAIASLLHEWQAGVTAVIDGLAASIGSYLCCLGRPTLIAADGAAMIHNAWTLALGDHHELRRTADTLEMFSAQITRAYVRKTGRPTAEVVEAMDRESWYTAQGALEFRLVDSIVDNEGVPIAASKRSLAEMQAQLDAARAMIHSGSQPAIAARLR